MTPATSLRLARGCTRTENTTQPSLATMSNCCPAPAGMRPAESAEAVNPSPGALILHGRVDLGVQFLRGSPGPIGISQEFPSQKNNVRLSSHENRVCLRAVGDHADCTGQNFCLLADRLSERNLIAESHRDL